MHVNRWDSTLSVFRAILSVNSQQQMHVTRLESTILCVQGDPISQQSTTNACYQTGIHCALCAGQSYQSTVSNKCMLPDWNPLCPVCRVILSVNRVNNKCMLTDGTPLCLCVGQSYQSTVNNKCMLPDWNPLCSVCRVILPVNSQQSTTNACYQTGIHCALCAGQSYQSTESATNACYQTGIHYALQVG